MNKKGLYLAICFSILASSTLVPAYAEVTSLKTSATFYTSSTKIYFTGTVANDDIGKVVYLAIHDPTGKFLSPLQGTMSNTDGTFSFTITPSLQYSAKGTYNATAFVAKESEGKLTNFVFSPDGSPVVPSPPTGLKATVRSYAAIDLSWFAPANNGGSLITQYKIERNDGNGFNVIQNIQTTTYQDTNLTASKQYSYRISATNSAGTSVPSNVASAITLSAPTQTTPPTNNPNNQGSSPSINDIIQQRIEAAKKLQDLLNAQKAKQKGVQITESVSMGDLLLNPVIEKSNPSSNTFASEFDFKNILYPVISVIGAGIVVTTLYFRKKRLPTVHDVKVKENLPISEPILEEPKDDYAFMILKNRLAKGEITVDQFKAIKEALSEP